MPNKSYTELSKEAAKITFREVEDTLSGVGMSLVNTLSCEDMFKLGAALQRFRAQLTAHVEGHSPTPTLKRYTRRHFATRKV